MSTKKEQEAATRAAMLTEMEALAAQMLGKEYLKDAVNELAKGLLAAIEQSDPTYFTRPVSPAATAKARALAETAARSLTEQLTKTQLREMGNVIADALIAGKRPRDIYNQLQQVQGLDRNRARTYLKLQEKLEQSGMSDKQVKAVLDREYQRLLQERRKTIAQNEGRVATSEARAVEAENRGNTLKRWITQSDPTVCEICAGNEADGVIPIDEAFSSGHMMTPGHPNCHCTTAYMPESAREIATKWANERIAQTAEARESIK